MGKSTIFMVIFHSYVKLPEGNDDDGNEDQHRCHDPAMMILPWQTNGRFVGKHTYHENPIPRNHCVVYMCEKT